ncbi:hypothetical protein PSN13_06494 [Micromonospora saelicesensis]|uniref:Uncharacterized protein n=1 Tax=Micromonospora saelicesensis TaxID=285676 RepID=A0A328NC17_9ACTN|nr:hypothetical protein PSN13_06494 [Micromonospora saelicesensis]
MYDPVLSRVRLAAPGLFDGAPVVVQRSTDQVRWVTVRGGAEVTPVAGTARLDDYEFAPDVVNRYRVLGPAVWDAFGRTASSGWGTADSGQAWVTSGGSASDFSVSAGVGRHSVGTVNALRHSLIDIGSTDGTITVDVTNPLGSPVGAPVTHWVVGRAADTGNYYYARLDIAHITGAATIILAKRVGGSISGLTSAIPVGVHSASTWRIVFDWRGSALRAKAWIPASTGEPDWQAQAIDTDLTAGTQAGVLTRLESGNSNTLPVVVTYDNVVVSPPLVVLYEGSITPVLGGVWLKSLARPFLNRQVTVRDFSPVTRPSRAGVFSVVGRSDPVAVTDVRGSRQWTVDVSTYSRRDAEDLDLLLASGDILLVQVPAAGRLSAVPDGYVTVGDSRETTPPTSDLLMRVFELPCTRAAAPGPDVVGATVTCQGVLNTYATCQAVLDAHPTCLSLLELIGSPTDVVVG